MINPEDEEEQNAAPTKEQLDEEKQLLLSFKPVMQKFLHSHINLQVSALYALQVQCNAKGFPKGKFLLVHFVSHRKTSLIMAQKLNEYCPFPGMLLRFFVNFYDMEIIEEEAFISWKEDVNQEYPGKGKALFQVILWKPLIFFLLVQFLGCSLQC